MKLQISYQDELLRKEKEELDLLEQQLLRDEEELIKMEQELNVVGEDSGNTGEKVFCAACGEKQQDSDANFCFACGAGLQ